MSTAPGLIEAMLRPDFWPGAAGKVDMLQTHISWVFLAGEHAWKVKKPVNPGFADFSTLERRKHFCERELELNRRLAPQLYLDVWPISRHGASFRLNDAGHVVEYCLKMARFPQQDLLDARLATERFDPAWMDILASDIARFHEHAAHDEAMQAWGEADVLDKHIRANLDVAARHADAAPADIMRVLQAFRIDSIRAHAADFRARQKARRIRDGHGDLHLRNIALFRGRPVAFDCIEFNDAFRLIDTMNDAAFLVMDCDARQRPDLGLRFLSRYLEFGGDYSGLALLPLFLAYRATVRGKVGCLLAEDVHADATTRKQALADARDYFRLAATYAQRPRPRLYAVCGFSGSGKSRLALAGCGPARAIIIRSDATRKRLAGCHAVARVVPADWPLYGTQMSARTYAAMFDAAKTALQAGFSVILDATFLRREDRNAVRQLARETGVKSRLLWLDAPPDELRRNIRQRMRQGQDESDADLNVLEHQLAHHPRPASEPDIRFIPSGAPWPTDD